MKLNPKVYNQLKNEPFEKQNINGKTVEFHYMNDTQFLYQFASRGRFSVWTSDGNNYRVLIEKKYYEAMELFYSYEVNKIWLNFLERVGGISKKINRLFMIPTLILYVAIAGIATAMFQERMLEILLFMVVLVVLSNLVQSRIVNKKVRAENTRTQDEIRAYIGVDEFDQLVKAQEHHYQEYFKFEEEKSEEISEEADENIEIDKKGDDKNGTESN